jgi:hypothetical protein
MKDFIKALAALWRVRSSAPIAAIYIAIDSTQADGDGAAQRAEPRQQQSATKKAKISSSEPYAKPKPQNEKSRQSAQKNYTRKGPASGATPYALRYNTTTRIETERRAQ